MTVTTSRFTKGSGLFRELHSVDLKLTMITFLKHAAETAFKKNHPSLFRFAYSAGSAGASMQCTV